MKYYLAGSRIYPIFCFFYYLEDLPLPRYPRLPLPDRAHAHDHVLGIMRHEARTKKATYSFFDQKGKMYLVLYGLNIRPRPSRGR